MRTNKLVLVYMRALVVLHKKKWPESKLAGQHIDLAGVKARWARYRSLKMLGKANFIDVACITFAKMRSEAWVRAIRKNGRHAGPARPCGMLAGHGTDWGTRPEENAAARLNSNGKSMLADDCRPCADSMQSAGLWRPSSLALHCPVHRGTPLRRSSRPSSRRICSLTR